MKTLLIEIGTEEIPARDAPRAADALANGVRDVLAENRLIGDDARLRAFFTPRRLAVMVEGCKAVQDDHTEVFTGPPWDRAFDASGKPTRAAIGFARSHGVEPEVLKPVEGKKGKVASVTLQVKGRRASAILAESLPGIITTLEFKRTMRWGKGQGPFVRPVHYLVGLLGDEVIPFAVFGLKADRVVRGHFFMHPEPVALERAEDYGKVMAERGVELDANRRKALILQGLSKIATKHEALVVQDDALLDEVANLVEYPFVLAGHFDERFLSLPAEVLIEAMRRHQRYFTFRRQDNSLAPVFGVVANTLARDMAVVVKGNERVLSARLYDADYFWNQDLKTGIDAMHAALGERVFMAGLGSVADKAVRLQALVDRLGPMFGCEDPDALRDAARLCKADLMSQMVGEFAELQGVMGGYYAQKAGYSETAAQAIKEHYLPRFAEDRLPQSRAGAILSIADRIDSIVAGFSKGYEPRAGKDPYAMRRQAVGLLRLLMAADRYVTVEALVDHAAAVLKQNNIPVADDVRPRVVDFIRDRFDILLRETVSVSADFVHAVLAIPNVPPKEALQRVTALKEVYETHAGFRDLMLAFKRMTNIRAKAPKDLVESADGVDEGMLDSDLEREVFEKARKDMTRVADLREKREFVAVLELMYGYQDVLERFFDTVRVLDAPTQAVAANRLALLGQVLNVFNWFADFAMISRR